MNRAKTVDPQHTMDECEVPSPLSQEDVISAWSAYYASHPIFQTAMNDRRVHILMEAALRLNPTGRMTRAQIHRWIQTYCRQCGPQTVQHILSVNPGFRQVDVHDSKNCEWELSGEPNAVPPKAMRKLIKELSGRHKESRTAKKSILRCDEAPRTSRRRSKKTPVTDETSSEQSPSNSIHPSSSTLLDESTPFGTPIDPLERKTSLETIQPSSSIIFCNLSSSEFVQLRNQREVSLPCSTSSNGEDVSSFTPAPYVFGTRLERALALKYDPELSLPVVASRSQSPSLEAMPLNTGRCTPDLLYDSSEMDIDVILYDLGIAANLGDQDPLRVLLMDDDPIARSS